jgi:hypothetical protein
VKLGGESRSRLDRLAAPLLCALAAGVFADVLLLGQRLFVRDVSSYYFAAKKIVRDTILAGEWPLWNRFFGAGQPMAANPEYAVFYPPHLLLLLPGYDWWFQALVVAHVAFGATGMYRFLRSIGLSGLAALYGAIAFAFGGITASLLNLLPYLFILAWMPWALASGRKWMLFGDRRALAAAAFAFGMQILTAEPSTLVQVWLMVGVWTLFTASERRERRELARLSGRLAALFVLSVAVGAVQLLPAIDHVGDSVRSMRFEYEAVVSWSSPPLRPLELLLPSLLGRPWFAGEGGYWGAIFYAPQQLPFLFSIYCGFPVLVLAVYGFVRAGRVARWLGVSCAAAYVLAIGGATPLFRVLFDLGPAQSFRYPEKLLIVPLVAIIVFAASRLDHAGDDRAVVSRIGVGLAVAGLVASVAALVFVSSETGLDLVASVGSATTAAGALDLQRAIRADWVLNVGRFAVFAILFFALRRNVPVKRWLAALVVIGFADLAVGFRAVSPSVDREFFEPPAVAARLDEQRDEWRVFPLANWYQAYGRSAQGSRFSETGAGTYWTVRNGMAPMLLSAWGFRQALELDYDRTALVPTTHMLQALWQIRNQLGDERDRSLMAMASARYYTRFRSFEREMSRAGSVREAEPVDYVEVPTNPIYWIPERIERVAGKEGFVSRFLESDPGPRTALVGIDPFDPSPCRILGVEEKASSARVEVECEGPSLLVANVTPHEYWKASIGNEDVEIVTVNLAYSGVRIPAGTHVVAFDYRNPIVSLGAVITFVALLVLLSLGWRTQNFG